MWLNWLAYNYRPWDGYGRFSARMVQALRRAGVAVTSHFAGAADAPEWLLKEWGVDWSIPTISCLPPYYLRKLPAGAGPHWLLTMTEGSECPGGWAEIINRSGVERVIVPCQHNAEAFVGGGVRVPANVVQGGTEPNEYPLREAKRDPDQPYTFLALADRGMRKGWDEARMAMYLAFGGKTTGDMDVRLIVKSRRDGNALINDFLAKAADPDPRIVYERSDVADMREMYEQVDCFVIPSRCEGWGMPHREAAMMGLPVITQRYSGMDDGHTEKWAIVVEGGQLRKVDADDGGHLKGQWRVCDMQELAAKMRWCYENRDGATAFGQRAAQWLRDNQTWDHSARALLALLQETGVFEQERVFA